MSRIFRPLLVFGTRAEAIKMAPLVRACLRRADAVRPIVCVTAQHRQLLDQVIDYFDLPVDEDLNLMVPEQTLASLTARCVEGLDGVFVRRRPDCVVAQGDTTSALAAGLAAFYRRIPVVHVEAGLRSGDLWSPWPEELNRRLLDMIAVLHCAPTQQAADALAAEGVPAEAVHVTGNTVIDALVETRRRETAADRPWATKYAAFAGQPVVLVTGHRRESFGQGIENLCRAVGVLADRFVDHHFVYAVHLNPEVQRAAGAIPSGRANVHLLAPPAYPEFVWLMDRSTLILTDSGGIQEEAPSLGKPVLVVRDRTERPELIASGAGRLVGTSTESIVREAAALLTDPDARAAMRIDENPYGDGHAAERIVELMLGCYRSPSSIALASSRWS